MQRDTAPELARAIAFQNAMHERLSPDTEAFKWGRGFFNATFPAIYDVNFLRVQRTAEDMTFDGLVAEADRLMEPRRLRHRKIVIRDEDAGEQLATAFAEAGWVVDRLLFMVHRQDPQRSAKADVDETAEEVHIAAKRRFNQESPYFENDAEVEQMLRVERLVYSATDKRSFAAYVDDTMASLCELYSDGKTAQIEDVGTLEAFRGRGLATSVVLRALEEARAWGHDMIFLVADDDDWPKDMYAKLGFEGVGRIYQFLLKPPKS